MITPCSIKVGTHEVTNCSNMSQRQIASCVLENFCEIFVSATEFCHSNMLQKIKSDRNCATATCGKKSNQTNCATCRSYKILLQRQRFSQTFSCMHEAICCCDVSSQHVAATSPRTCTHGEICHCDLLLQLVA